MPTPAAMPSWEEVLAAVEADVRRTEELLIAAALPADIDGVQSFVTLAHAPRPPAGPDELPSLEDMPAVPHELLGRIEALRTRVTTAQLDLEVSLDSAERQPAVPRRLGAFTPDLRARYIDTTL